jgi:hypothetical protein
MQGGFCREREGLGRYSLHRSFLSFKTVNTDSLCEILCLRDEMNFY